ncbi:hypothetical protein [Actinomadura oligospora]|uniref:hypothetical protein n=1 Tax=Actinomadura oligospora TaxID=111804 RepID=UPI00047B419C|nr:hypothetical protein [Actinomadura oligospora]
MDSWIFEDILSVIGVFVLLTTVITVGIRQVAGVKKARAQAVHDQDYHRMAETALLLQEHTELRLREIGARLDDIGARLDDMGGRVESMERILKEVE